MSIDGDSWFSDRERRRLTRIWSDRAVVAALAGTGLIAAFMQTLVIPVVPQLPLLLDTTVSGASWVLTATLLAAAISTPISGRLGDMYGKRRMLLILLVIMSVGSIVCAFSNTLGFMVVGRSLQGIGLGAISLGISVLRDVLHRASLGKAIALVSATLGIGGAGGLPVAALITENFDYHFLFWLAALLNILAFVAVLVIVPVSTLRTGGRFDLPGAIGFGIGLVAILLAVSKGNEWGWNSPRVLGLFGGSVLVFAGWVGLELRAKNPLIDLRIASRTPVLLTNITSVTVGFAFFVINAALPVLLQSPNGVGAGLGQSMMITSLCLMPSGLIMFFISSTAARLSAAKGAKTSLLLGCSILAVNFGFAPFMLTEVWQILIISTVSGLGIGFAYAAMPNLIMAAVPSNETAAANGLNSVMRTIGSSSASTMVGVLLSTWFVMESGVAVPTVGAFQITFLASAGIVIGGVIVAAFIPRHDHRYDQTASIPVQNPLD